MAILTGRRRQSEEAVIQLNRLSKHQKQSKFFLHAPLVFFTCAACFFTCVAGWPCMTLNGSLTPTPPWRGFYWWLSSVSSNHLNTGHPNTGFIWIPDSRSVRYSNGLYHSKTGQLNHSKTWHFCRVFKWFGSTDTKIMVDHWKTEPLLNRTHLDLSKTGLVLYSDGIVHFV